MSARLFTTNDQGFTCAHCGLVVRPLGSSSRNHCPACLYSLHVDHNPGDRANGCRGLMAPVGVVTEGKRGYLLVHRCEKCGEIRRNRAVPDARDQPDSMEMLIRLTAGPAPGGAAAPKGRRPHPTDPGRSARYR